MSGQPNKRLFLLTFRELNIFSLRSSFFRTSDRWQGPTQWPIIDQHPVKQPAYRREIKDHGYKSVFTYFWLVYQRNRSWIKGLGQKSTKEWTLSLLAVPFVWATEPWPPGLREMIACIQVKRHNGTACMACWHLTRLPPKHTKIGMRV